MREPTSMPEEIPAGLENLLALAAVNEAFAEALKRNPEAAAHASEVELTDSERAMLAASTPESVQQLAAAVRERMDRPGRRRFLELATAAVATLAAGGAVTLSPSANLGPVALAGALRADPPPATGTGSRPDRPTRPRPDSREHRTTGISPDRPAPRKKTTGSGCNR